MRVAGEAVLSLAVLIEVEMRHFVVFCVLLAIISTELVCSMENRFLRSHSTNCFGVRSDFMLTILKTVRSHKDCGQEVSDGPKRDVSNVLQTLALGR